MKYLPFFLLSVACVVNESEQPHRSASSEPSPRVVAPVISAETGPARISDGGRIHAPVVIYRVDPAWPAIDRPIRISPFVRAELIVTRAGRVKNVRITNGQDGPFAEAARAALEQWRFEPGTVEGKPVDTVFAVTFNINVK